ncbi:hypothetical protein I3842_05G151700, partial [Carya illinoinensis]
MASMYRSKGSIGHAFTVCIRTGNQNQTSFYPFVPDEISVLVELILGHLRYLLTDVPPQPNSPPDNVFCPDRPAEMSLGSKKRGNASPPVHEISKITVSSTGSSFLADSAKPIPLAVVSLDSRQGQWESHYEAFGYLKRVIVTPAIYPRLVEFLHFDIQSTGQKSHCVSIRRDHRNAFPSPGQHAATRSRRGSSSSSPPTANGQSFSQGYGSILPTSLAYIVPSTRGCSPWRPDAIMSTTGPGWHLVLQIFKGHRGRTGHHAKYSALPAAGPYHWLSRSKGGQCRSHGTFPLFGLQSSHLNICYYHQDLHRQPLRPGSRPRFCSDRRALLLIGACAQLGTVTRLPVHPASPVLLTKNGPLGALDSLARLNKAARPSYLFKSFAPIPKSDERFARQYRCGPPPEFPLASPHSRIVHHLLGPDRYALTRTLLRRSRSVGGATHKGIPPISFLAPYGFTSSLTRTHVILLGLCFKTGRMGHDYNPSLGRRRNLHPSTPRVDRQTGIHHSTSDWRASPTPIRFPLDNFKHSLTLFSKIYRPIGAAFPNNPTRRLRLVVQQGPGTTGLSLSPAPPSRALGPSSPLRTLLQTTIRMPSGTRFSSWALPGRRALGRMASGATCVQRLNDSRDSAIHTKYRISLHSSLMREPRYPLPRVVMYR